MPITKTLKRIGQQKPKNIYAELSKRGNKILRSRNEKEISENLNDIATELRESKREWIDPDFIKKFLIKKYPEYQKVSRKIIWLTEKMLNIIKEKPELKDANFYFIERDALPYMYAARELCQNHGFNSHQFREISWGWGVEYEKKRYDDYKEYLTRNIDLNKPIVILDVGLHGTYVHKIRSVLRHLGKCSHTVLFTFRNNQMAKNFYNMDTLIESEGDVFTILDTEQFPKFKKKTSYIEKQNDKIKLTKTGKENGERDIIAAEIFLIAFRNQLAKYKMKKGKNI